MSIRRVLLMVLVTLSSALPFNQSFSKTQRIIVRVHERVFSDQDVKAFMNRIDRDTSTSTGLRLALQTLGVNPRESEIKQLTRYFVKLQLLVLYAQDKGPNAEVTGSQAGNIDGVKILEGFLARRRMSSADEKSFSTGLQRLLDGLGSDRDIEFFW